MNRYSAVDFGKLTPEQTQSIALEALANLTIDQAIEVIKRAIRGDDRAELIAQLEDK